MISWKRDIMKMGYSERLPTPCSEKELVDMYLLWYIT